MTTGEYQRSFFNGIKILLAFLAKKHYNKIILFGLIESFFKRQKTEAIFNSFLTKLRDTFFLVNLSVNIKEHRVSELLTFLY